LPFIIAKKHKKIKILTLKSLYLELYMVYFY